MIRTATVDILPLDSKISDGDLEYHVCYAQGTSRNECKEPVVVIFGWGGCNDKYLAKYSVIYENVGCTTFRCIVAPKILFPGKRNEEKLQSVAEKIVNVLRSLKFDEHPVYFHSFSNAGSTVYCYVSKIIQSLPGKPFKVKGCIFDSAPAKIYAQNIIAAVVESVKGSTATKYSYAFLVLSYIYAVAGYNWMSSLAHCDRPSSRRFEMYDTLASEPNICPQLFLFSKLDDVCPYESIQEFVDIRASKGVETSTVLWDDSAHVKHLVMYKEEYINAVLKFINSDVRILQDREK